MMPDLALALFGPLQISCNDAPVTGLESNKVRGLLIYLAVEADRPHARAALAGLLWPDQPAAAAQHNLRQALANLRRALGDRTADPPFLLINRETVQLNPASTYRLDVVAFTELLAACETHPHRRAATCALCVERRASAAALYRGDFLAHFFLSDSAAFEEWVSLKRERLRQQALGALALLAAYHEQHGAYAAAERAAWRQVELDPWNEEAHRQLMHVLWLSGQRHAALAHYVRCCDMLRRELGVEPAPETVTLYAHIRDTEPDTAAPSRNAGRMPAAATPFIGREAELAHLADLLQHPVCRLITLTGPGGIGKTRLALQAASEATMIFAHGVCFVSLAQLTSADLLVPAIATSLNLVLDGRSDLKERLFSYLCDKQALLVLDNFEHLLGESSTPIELLSELLQRTAGVSVLVTSRERLRLRGEWVVDVAGLSYPQSMQTEEPGAYSAVELFLQRARQVHGSFAPTVEDTRWVTRICRLVAGMPLGIELAAGWVRTLSCQEIAHEIDRSLDFLSGSLRDLPTRHRSLRAVLDYSWKALAPDEQAAVRRLSVFRGGFTREAAEQVAGASARLLQTLVDRSLLRRTSTGRYDLHELVHRYADEKLQEEGPDEALRQHAAYFLGLVEQAEPSLWGGPDQRAWLECLEGEHDNVRAALQWALDRGEADFDQVIADRVGYA